MTPPKKNLPLKLGTLCQSNCDDMSDFIFPTLSKCSSVCTKEIPVIFVSKFGSRFLRVHVYFIVRSLFGLRFNYSREEKRSRGFSAGSSARCKQRWRRRLEFGQHKFARVSTRQTFEKLNPRQTRQIKGCSSGRKKKEGGFRSLGTLQGEMSLRKGTWNHLAFIMRYRRPDARRHQINLTSSN